MTAILLTLAAALWSTPTSEPSIDGKATYYNPGVMEQVAANRGLELGNAAGFVALNRAGDIGRLVWLERSGMVYGPYIVADCARRGAHYEERERRRLVVEVSWEQAKRWLMIGPMPVRVHFFAPEPEHAF